VVFFLTRFVAKLFFEGPPPALPPELIQIFKYKNADWDKYRREIMRTVTRTTPANTPDEIEAQINTFTNTMHSARDIVFKPTTIPKNRTPLPTRIVKLIKEKRKVYREFIQTRDPLLKTLFNKLNAQIRRDINRYREETWIKTCESLDYRDGKKFWNKFKVITGQKRKTNHYLATDAHIYYTPQERANCFAEQLDGIHQVPNDPNFNATFFDQIANNVHAFKNIPLIDPLPHPLHNEHLTDNITTDEVKTIISLLKNTKAPGPDQIRPILLKNLPNSAFQALTDIFNNCMNNLYFPTAWKTAHTVMIPKPGKCPNDPKSYRPISLLSITGKIFEKILTNRLQLTLESNNHLPPEQFSFPAQRSTHNPLAELRTDITRHANTRVHRRCLPRHPKSIRQGLARRTRAETPKPPPEPYDLKWVSDSTGLSGGFRGKGCGFRYGRQATFLSWFRLVQLPGQVLSFYSSEGVESKFFLNVK
jgi:hypothetical protein